MCASPPLKAYLSEDDFKKVFEISVQEFRALPKWKQGNLKKKVDLFWVETRVSCMIEQS